MSPYMRRELIPGETIPLDRFADVLKERARRLGAEVLSRQLTTPAIITELLEASPADLRVVQLRSKLTYADVEAWMNRILESSEES